MIDERWHPPVEVIIGLNPQSEGELKKLFSIGAAVMAWGVSEYRTERGREWMLYIGDVIERPLHDFIALEHAETGNRLTPPVCILEKSSLLDFTLLATDCMEIMDFLQRIGGVEPGSNPINSVDPTFLSVVSAMERWMKKNYQHYHSVMTDVALLDDTDWPFTIALFDNRKSMMSTDKLAAYVPSPVVDMCEGCGFELPCVEGGVCRNCAAQMTGDIASIDCTHFECHMINCEHCWNEDMDMIDEIEEDDLYQRDWSL